jgi:hypothetical protein
LDFNELFERVWQCYLHIVLTGRWHRVCQSPF